jgi:hypothetical protein
VPGPYRTVPLFPPAIFYFFDELETFFFTFRMCLVRSGRDSHSFRVPFIPATFIPAIVDSRLWHFREVVGIPLPLTAVLHSYEVGMYRCICA